MKSYQKVFKRTEKKYLATREQYENLIGLIGKHVAPDEYGETQILNIYYDTPDHSLIRRSLDKPKYKEKLRLRCYGIPKGSDNAFIELKKKYRGVVYKRRIEMPYRDALRYLNTGTFIKSDGKRADNEEQITREVDYFMNLYQGIAPMMVISYDRIAVNWIDEPGIRITYDTNIRYREDHLDLSFGNSGDLLLPKGTRLIEIKLQGSMPTELARALSESEIFPTSISKYGRAYQTVSSESLLTNYNPYLEEVKGFIKGNNDGKYTIRHNYGERTGYNNELFDGNSMLNRTGLAHSPAL